MADAGALIQSGIENLTLTRKLSFWRKADKVQELDQFLTTIRTTLKDHEEVNYKSIEIIRWLQSLKTLFEDVHEAVACRKQDKQRGCLSRIKQAVKPDSAVEEELKAFMGRYQELCRRKQMLCRPQDWAEERTKTIVGSVSSEPVLFGRESEFRKIIDLLDMPSDVESRCDFIAIVGMDGIGKTTLAQHVYNNDKVASFTERAWCYARDLNMCQIYRSMFEQLLEQYHFKDSPGMLERSLKELKGKKCLIVLDDFWNEDDDFWNEDVAELGALRSSLMAANPGSKVIITTRNRAVAKQFTAEERIIDLGLMSNEDCWSLFCSGTRLNSNSTSNLAIIGKKICDKCKGLPLAVAVMRGMILGVDEEADWKAVLNDFVSCKNRSIICWIKQAVKPDSTVEKLKAYMKRYEELCRKKKNLCGPLERDEKRTRIIIGSVSSEPILFGREREFRKIIDFLDMPSDVENGCDFIAIVGMGGIGKTTLAQFVYNYDKVASFNERAWCYARDLNICQIYRSMFEQLIGQCHFQDSSAMLGRLHRELKGKKCLIVLDDFSNEEGAELEALRASLMAAKSGSKYIITTRDRAIARRFTRGEERIVDLGLLSNEDCWSLFCSGTSLESNSTSNLATIGKEICDKCEGLPLRVNVVKGILSGIREEAGWKSVLNNLVS